MTNFKILLPVTSPAELVRQKLIDLQGLENHLIIINNWIDKETEKYVKEFAAKGAEAYDCTYNLGLAASWNLGLKRMMEDQDDFVLILSASAIFDKDIRYIIDLIVDIEAKQKYGRHIVDPRASLHCFVHTRLGVEQGGYFDENFWPIYFEDTDFSYRSKLNGFSSNVTLADNLVHSRSISAACNSNSEIMKLHQYNCHRWHQYYLDKWGGDHLSEKYSHPFNNKSIGINEWTIRQPFYHTLLNNKKWLPPSMLEKYQK